MSRPAVTQESIQAELDRHLFHLRTLYDISRDLLGMHEVNGILRHFLFMTTGNFGVVEGFLAFQDRSPGKTGSLVSIGWSEEDRPLLTDYAGQILSRAGDNGHILEGADLPGILDRGEAVRLAVPFLVENSCRGVLGLGHKIVGEGYTDDDKELLVTLVNNLTIALKSALDAEALEEAYGEVSILNRAKDKVINHLSHELKTPLSLLGASLRLLERKLKSLPDKSWEKTLERARRNLDRLMVIQDEVEDIMYGKELKTYSMLNFLLDQCADELEILVAEKLDEGPVVDYVRRQIETFFGPRESDAEELTITDFVRQRLENNRPLFAHRQVALTTRLDPTPPVIIAPEALEKIIHGLVRNGIENTPDGGTVEVEVKDRKEGVELLVRDHGVGITEENQKRIFEGFYPTQETEAYSSKRPYDFNAGGKGADLLRMRIFSERFHFKLHMTSERCRHIADAENSCPGDIGRCTHCHSVSDCMNSGGTVFRILFPAK